MEVSAKCVYVHIPVGMVQPFEISGDFVEMCKECTCICISLVVSITGWWGCL